MRVSKPTIPTNCPECNSLQGFSVKTDFWTREDGVECFRQYVRCLMCRYEVKGREGTKAMFDLLQKEQRLKIMKARRQPVDKNLKEVRDKIRLEMLRYE